jgi:hypothetical protein
MAVAVTPHLASQPGLLGVPVETRLHIYSYLIPSRLDINLCDLNYPDPRPAELLPPPSKNQKQGPPTSTLVSQNLTVEFIARANGLNLLCVCATTAFEISAILSKTTVRFHCPKCFDQWLSTVSYGLGVGISWLKRVEIQYDVETQPRIFGPDLNVMTPPLSKFMVIEMLKQCQQTAYAYFGRLDLMDPPRERWEYEPLQEEPPLWEGHPNYPDGEVPDHFSQAMFYHHAYGGIYQHPWVMNQGFPPPGMGLPPFHDIQMTSRSLRRGLAIVLPREGRWVPDEDWNFDYGPATRCWIIKAEFDI